MKAGPQIHADLHQGSEEWLQARCGLLTASEMKLIITPKLKVADNDKSRAHLYELLAQRISGYVEPGFVGYDMLRGQEDEIAARDHYAEHYMPVTTVGFITNDRWGFTLGYSPDGLVGTEGLIEAKSRKQKFQVETIIADEVPEEHVIQVQAALLISERKWCDFISFSGGLPMVTIEVEPDPIIQDAILTAAAKFEDDLNERLSAYRERIAAGGRLIPTERRIYEDMHL
jgi:hypothetical protein